MRSVYETVSSGHHLGNPHERLAVDGLGSDDGRGLKIIDDLLEIYARQREEEAALSRVVLLERHRFVHAAACTFARVVRPAFQSIAERLNDHGGGGLIS